MRLLPVLWVGPWMVSSRGRDALLGPPGAVLISDAEFASVTCPSMARSICIQLPRKTLAPLVRDLDDTLMRPIDGQGEALQLLIGYAQMLRASAVPSSAHLQRLVSTHVRDLVAAVLGASPEGMAIAEQGGLRAGRAMAGVTRAP